MKNIVFSAALVFCFTQQPGHAAGGFDVITLGALGGIQDGNLSAYLVRPRDDQRAVTCDAGTLVNGLRVADERGSLDDTKMPEASPNSRIGHVLTEQIKGYLITHAHYDHIGGLVIASPDDSKKTIYALASVNGKIEKNYFNWEAWPNFSNRGKAPQLNKYVLQDLGSGQTLPLKDTAMTVTAFPLSHGGVESTAFLLESGDDALLCFGDTGPDAVEKSTLIGNVWKAVAAKVKQGRLKAILIETSYNNARPDNLLFGHLTPNWLLRSLRELDQAAGGNALKNLPVLISHIKYSFQKGDQPQKQILEELQSGNDLGVQFLIPRQGDRFSFP